MTTTMVRIRVRFDDSCSQNGLLQSWFAVAPAMRSIGDVADGIVSAFQLEQSCPNGVLLFMEDFVLPAAAQSILLLQDRDLVSVKPKAPVQVQPLPLENSQQQYGMFRLHGVTLRAIEEFEKESGGYKSEEEDFGLEISNEDGSEQRMKDIYLLAPKGDKRIKSADDVVNKAPRISKRKRSSKEKTAESSKKRRMRRINRKGEDPKDLVAGEDDEVGDARRRIQDSEEDGDNVGKIKQQGMYARRRIQDSEEDGHNVGKIKQQGIKELEMQLDSTVRKQSLMDDLTDDDESGQINDDKSRTETKKILDKGPSRSSKRKKAKRQWLRRQAAEAKECDKSMEIRHQERYDDGDRDIAIAAAPAQEPIVVAPGHIRFEPLDSDEENENGRRPMPILNFGSELRSKRQGQSWGKQKSSSAARKEEKQRSYAYDNWKMRETEWHGHVDMNPQREPLPLPSPSPSPSAPSPSINFEELRKLEESPKEGDVLAYRLVELGASRTPELSSFRVGRVTCFEGGVIRLDTVPEHPVRRATGASEEEEGDDYDDGVYNADGSLQVDYAELVDVRVMGSVTEGRNDGGVEKLEEKENEKKKSDVASVVEANGNGKGNGNKDCEIWRLKSMRAAGLSSTMALLRKEMKS